MAKEFQFQGKSLEDVKKLSLNELLPLLPSRQRRSLKHGFNDQQKKLLKKIELAQAGKLKKTIKTHVRDMIVIPQMIGVLLLVHRGKEFVPVKITEEMIGHYLGEFTYNRVRVKHSAPGIGATRSSAAVSVK